jgi:hypothetical protein|tara:strand:+ start:303 stop:824 length:522 start_codon:yes stop_codon:yes gene_type:complete
MDISLLKEKAVDIQAILGLKLIELKREASGALINSFTNEITDLGNYAYDIQIKGLNYWKYVEFGTEGANIPYDARKRTGQQANAYIEGLMRWIKIKGIASDNETVKAIAFAIATKQTAKGGWGRGNPMDKNKLGFVRKTQIERDNKCREMAEAFQSEIVSLVSLLPNQMEIII